MMSPNSKIAGKIQLVMKLKRFNQIGEVVLNGY